MHVQKYISDFAFLTSSREFYWDMVDISIDEAELLCDKWLAEPQYLTVRLRPDNLEKIHQQNRFDMLKQNEMLGSLGRRFPSAPCEMLIIKPYSPPNKNSTRIYCSYSKNVSKNVSNAPSDDHIFGAPNMKNQTGVEASILDNLVKASNELVDLSKRERVKKAIMDIFGFIA